MVNFKDFYMDNFGSSCTSFKGRMSRKEYMIATFLMLITTTPMVLISAAVMFVFKSTVLAYMLFFVTAVFVFIAGMAINIKRLHDLDLPGLAVLGFGVPPISFILPITMFAVRGTIGTNQYGESNVPDDIGETYVMNGERISLITCLPAYLKQNIYNKYMNNLFSTAGRGNRRDYFIKIAGCFVIYQVFSIVFTIMEFFTDNEEIFASITVLVFVVTAVLVFIADIRRSHDLGRSWISSLLFLIPFVNFWHIAKQMSMPGSNTSNEYGACTVELDEYGVPMDDF